MVVSVYVRTAIVQVAEPGVCSRVLRGTPEVAVVTYVVETSIGTTVTARKACKAAAVGGPGVGAVPVACPGFFHFSSGNTFTTEICG